MSTRNEITSEASEPINNNDSHLSSEAQLRVDTVVNSALKILESTPEIWNAIQETFNKMVTHNMRDPENIKTLLDWLYEKHKEHTKNLTPDQKLVAENSFTKFVEAFSQNIAYMHRDVNWSNELNAIKNTFEAKRKSIQLTYNNLLTPPTA